MSFVILAALIGLIPAAIASSKGHSFALWWFYGAAIFIVALPHSLLVKPNQQELDQEQLDNGLKKCPQCAEFVRGEARICRFCRHAFEQSA